MTNQTTNLIKKNLRDFVSSCVLRNLCALKLFKLIFLELILLNCKFDQKNWIIKNRFQLLQWVIQFFKVSIVTSVKLTFYLNS